MKERIYSALSNRGLLKTVFLFLCFVMVWYAGMLMKECQPSVMTMDSQPIQQLASKPTQQLDAKPTQHLDSKPTKPMLTVFPIFSLETDPSQNLSHYNPRPSVQQLEARMTDFMECLSYSLDHSLVGKVVLMYTQDAMPGYVNKRLGNQPKLKFDRVSSTYDVGKVLGHIHDNYQNELVLLTNGDVYPGYGLHLVDYDLMKSKKLFYGLSRHGKQEKRCRMRGQTCDKDTIWYHAQDSYIFIPTQPLPEKAKKLVKGLMWDYLAQEYVLLYIYHSILKYKVLNPCNVIFMFHNHCSGLHHTYRPYFGNKTVYFNPPHSSDLQ